MYFWGIKRLKRKDGAEKDFIIVFMLAGIDDWLYRNGPQFGNRIL